MCVCLCGARRSPCVNPSPLLKKLERLTPDDATWPLNVLNRNERKVKPVAAQLPAAGLTRAPVSGGHKKSAPLQRKEPMRF
jgi:hypothetical protein